MATTMEVLAGTERGLVDAGSGRTVAFEGHDVSAVAGRWVVVDGERLAAVEDPAGLEMNGRALGVRITCLDARPGAEPLVGTAEAHLYRLGDEPRRVVAFDEAEGRDRWYTPWGGPPDVRSLCTAPSGAILVNVHVGGILRSDDDGGEWRATIDLHHDVHQVLALDGRAAVAACAHGFAVSEDDGSTWAVDEGGLHATYSRAVALAGEMVLLSVSSGPQGRQAAVYRRPLGADGDFERCRAGLPEWFEGNVDTFCLVGAPDGGAALATRSGEVYVSGDEGATWEQAASGLPSMRCLALA
ncbi:MAG: hypothetical protein M3378_08050 [Actinomycetota bacterium]|nr:hypothetical protein [Actinomycetota bacterium]MDQ3680480.1 hypothetical protein [Actinomycetota bacterium]